MRKYHWSSSKLGPVVSGIDRERRWLSGLPEVVFTRIDAQLVWCVGVDEARKRLQALVLAGWLERRGRRADGIAWYEVVGWPE